MSVFKSLEQYGRILRCYLLPKFLKSAKLTLKDAVSIPSDKKICLLDFDSLEIDAVMARYFCLLVFECRSLGYHIVFVKRHKFLATTHHKQFKKLAFNEPYSLTRPDSNALNTDLVITDRIDHKYMNSKVIHLSYEHIHVTNTKYHFAFPFFAHPNIYHTSSARKPNLEEKRTLRILFAGNTNRSAYDRPVLADKYNMLSRVKVLDTLRRELPSEQVLEPNGFNNLFKGSSASINTLTIANTDSCSIPSEEWLNSLGKSDFFLACPGAHMPLCHNLIEALSTGTIPILQYHNYLSPSLEHGKNCLTFTDKDSLISVINKALVMSTEQLYELRNNARQYYIDHHHAGVFLQKLINSPESSVTLFFNSYKAPI